MCKLFLKSNKNGMFIVLYIMMLSPFIWIGFLFLIRYICVNKKYIRINRKLNKNYQYNNLKI